MISAFGNSSGGVIIWGIDCSYNPQDAADLPRGKNPITNVQRFISRLEGVVSGCTIPPHPKVVHYSIKLPNCDDGFVATLIPESYLAPHQNRTDSHYYIRVGSTCEPAPHSVLAGMFGKKPTPNIFLMFMRSKAEILPGNSAGVSFLHARFQFGFVLAHTTPVIARDLYFSLQCATLPGPNCRIAWTTTTTDDWKGHVFLNGRYSLYTVDQYKLPPETHSQPGGLDITLAPPFEHNLEFECWWGCADSPIQNLRHTTSPETLGNAWQKYVTNRNLDGHEFVSIVLPLGDQQ